MLKSKVRSNAFFLVPLILALNYHLFLYAGIIGCVMIFSTMFHMVNEKKVGTIDKTFAYILIACNLYSCYLSGFKQPYFSLALVFMLIGFYFFFKKKRDDYERHISCAIITIFCILAYIA